MEDIQEALFCLNPERLVDLHGLDEPHLQEDDTLLPLFQTRSIQ